MTLLVKFIVAGILNAALCCALLLGPFQLIGRAAVSSAITSDGTLGTAITKSGNVFDINGGTIKGTNQFHSFGQFTVGTGDTASFNGPNTILNILSRVTGGQQSQIDGMLRSTIPGANLYLMNPAGILFGPNASLDLSGSFHVTTADYLRLADNVRFNAVPDAAKDALLTTAPVAAFGFLGPTASPISVEGGLRLGGNFSGSTPASTLSIIGGDILITGGASALGRLQIASVASAGEAIPSLPGETSDLNVDSFSRLGNITVLNSTIGTSGRVSGATDIRANNVVLVDSQIFALSEFASETPFGFYGIDIRLRGDLTINGGRPGPFSCRSQCSIVTDIGDIAVKANRMVLENGQITIFDELDSSGRTTPANMQIDAKSITIEKSGNLSTFTDSSILVGSITINADNLVLKGTIQTSGEIFEPRPITINANESVLILGGTISNGTNFSINSHAGPITIIVPTLTLDNGQITSLLAGAGNAGNAGDITLAVKQLTLRNGAVISSSVLTAFNNGGAIIVPDADVISITGPTSAILTTGPDLGGRGGDIKLHGHEIHFLDGARIAASSTVDLHSNSSAGVVEVKATSLIEMQNSEINTSVNLNSSAASKIEMKIETNQAIGTGGNISMSAPTGDMMMTHSTIQAVTETTGTGGTISVNVRNLTTDGAILSAKSSSTGDAGSITIAVSDGFVSKNSSVTTEAINAAGGSITITAPSLIHLVRSQVTTTVQSGTGNGGNITIDPQFVVLDHSQIIANAFGGSGGNINITAGVFLVDPSSILSASSALGVNGTIQIQSPVQNLSGTLSPLPASLLKIAPLTAACAARAQGGSMSSFTVAGRDGVPAEPGGLLPSPLQQTSLPSGPSQVAVSADPDLPLPVLISMNWEGRCLD